MLRNLLSAVVVSTSRNETFRKRRYDERHRRSTFLPGGLVAFLIPLRQVRRARSFCLNILNPGGKFVLLPSITWLSRPRTQLIARFVTLESFTWVVWVAFLYQMSFHHRMAGTRLFKMGALLCKGHYVMRIMWPPSIQGFPEFKYEERRTIQLV